MQASLLNKPQGFKQTEVPGPVCLVPIVPLLLSPTDAVSLQAEEGRASGDWRGRA